MKFGVCCGVEEAASVLKAGFDYVELAAVGFSGQSSEWDPAPYRGLPVEATNVFFPGQIRLIGTDRTEYLDYAGRTIQRAASLGVKVMVIGSGGSRRAPDGVDGDAEFLTVCEQIAQLAGSYGIAIAPESLNRGETNVGNDLRSLALGLEERGIAFTADSYHVLYEWEQDGRPLPLENLWREQLPIKPAHVHIARLEGRSAPRPDDEMLRGFVRRLRELGFDERVSLECSRPEGFDFHEALADTKALFEQER